MDPLAQTTVTTPAPGVRAAPQDKRPGELNYLPLEMFDDGEFKEVRRAVGRVALWNKLLAPEVRV
jgi:hypothetical protein